MPQNIPPFKGWSYRRADDITKVKGVLLSPTQSRRYPSIPELSDEYEVVVTKKVTLMTFPCALILPDTRMCSGKAKLVDQLRIKTNLAYNIEFCPQGNLPRYEVKAKRSKTCAIRT